MPRPASVLERLARGGGLPRVLALAYAGSRYHCPICERGFRTLLPANQRELVLCPGCGSRERHRHLWLFLREATSFFGAPGRVLHVAPEPSLFNRLSSLPQLEYVPGDLHPRPGARRLDVTEIDFPDDCFDWIFCLHVLEHVSDDVTAMSELHRVLRPGGTAIIEVPVMRESTVEDPGVTDPAERLRRFGQSDHVRVYGNDFYDRLRSVGFEVELRLFRDEIGSGERERLGLNYHFPAGFEPPDDPLWRLPICRKSRA